MNALPQQLVAVPDPNWLLSTTAQSAAALVAIIGGFLLQKTIALKSEILTLNREKKMLTLKKGIICKQRENARLDLQLSNTKWFFSRHSEAYRKYSNENTPVDIEELWLTYTPPDIEKEDKEAISVSLMKVIDEIRNDPLKGDGQNQPSNVESQSIGSYQNQIELKEFVKRRLEKPNSKPIGNSTEGRSLRVERVTKYMNLNFELSKVQLELESVIEGLKSNQERKNLFIGFYILVSFGAGAIVWPLYLLSRNSPGSKFTSVTVIILFFVGFVAFVVYMLIIVFLARDESQKKSFIELLIKRLFKKFEKTMKGLL